VTRLRAFLNTDLPALADIWNRQPESRCRAQPITSMLLERHVMCKPYFDRHGLIVAESDEGRPVGFVHAGFGPRDDFAQLSTELGVVCMLLVADGAGRDAIARDLLAAAEQYLHSRGARVIYAGQIFPLDPFYLGLYGGSEMPGVPQSDQPLRALLDAAGYQEADRVTILQADATGSRPTMDRKQLMLRRKFQTEARFDPPSDTWWEACTRGVTERTRFVVRPKGSETPCGQATFWDVEPLASSWGVHAVGLVQLEVDHQHRRQGLATLLISEAMRQLHGYGVTRVEVQTMQRNTAAVHLYQRLGFQQVDEGVVLRKPA